MAAHHHILLSGGALHHGALCQCPSRRVDLRCAESLWTERHHGARDGADDPIGLWLEFWPRAGLGLRASWCDVVAAIRASWDAGFLGAIALATPFSIIFGWLYAKLLNKVKGEEMTIAMYVGFSFIMFMCIMWLILPYSNPTMVWGYAGKGLRTTISVENYWLHILNDFLAIRIGQFFVFPTGLLLFVALFAFLMWLFLRTKTGTAMTAVGSNPDFARASGVDVDKMRTISIIISTFLGAVGIIVYEQSFGFIQLYTAPSPMVFPAVAAILIGGASINKASMVNVIVGTILFQGLLTMTPSVINSLLQTDMSEVIRIIVSNGMILYALTRKIKVSK